ncbi:NmrA family transcriptional regulator [Actinocatenispora thailandica]|uniref:NmrA family transcriptional regulator n=1 Tax=Actinocatenispora thailandica TaxID=227318 RepID=A0A7R7HYN6_9ACTN|nr:NAD(P)H-binding protein [Actinocatenispora thailandica]BCJ36439.1 NmrA family transcriptional regulator [Actinocatenispora thailandica]
MIVVTGATGNIGGPLVRALADAGEQVVAVSRTAAEVPDGVTHATADLTDATTLAPVLAGADALFLLLADPRLDPALLADTAVRAGVRRIVLLSSQGAGTRSESPSHGWFLAAEKAVLDTPAAVTVLRPGGFASNAYQWAASVRADRTVAAPYGDVSLPVVDPDDIAAVAATVLRSDDHAGRTYVLTGPAPISPRQQAAALGAALGEPVGFSELSRADARAAMLAFMPGPIADTTLDVLGHPSAEERQVSPDVEALLRRAPGSFAGWAARNADAFR